MMRVVTRRIRTRSRRWAILPLAIGLAAAPALADAADTTGRAVSGRGDTVASADEPTSGGTLRYMYPIGPSRFDPHKSSVGQDIRIYTLVYDRLVHYDAVGDLMPGLATEWSFSDDGLQMTLTLRDGVILHDGSTLDGEVVKANLERGLTVEGSTVAGDLAAIESIDVPDPLTVVLNLSEPNAALPGILSSRAGVIVPVGSFDANLDLQPVGAGPYRVTEYRENDIIVFERFTDYWDDNYGGPDRIEWRIVLDENTRLNALRSGEVDAALLTGRLVVDAENAGLNVEVVPALSYQTLYLNRGRSEFDDVRVRQAISHAIDREAYVQSVLDGAGVPTIQDFPADYYAYNPDYPLDYYAFDQDRARELLAEAGVPDGFTFEVLVPSSAAGQLSAQVVQGMLAEVGITMQTKLIESAQAGELMFGNPSSDSLLAQFGGRSDPQITMDLQYSPTGFLNAAKDSTDRYVELSDIARATLDPDERALALQAMEGEIVEQAFTIPIAHDANTNAWRDGVYGLTLLVGGEIDFSQVGVEAA